MPGPASAESSAFIAFRRVQTDTGSVSIWQQARTACHPGTPRAISPNVALRWFFVLALSASACGGSTTKSESAEPAVKSCTFDGQTYPSGSDVKEAGCTCACHDGEITCLLLPCPNTCTYAGVGYQAGQKFRAEDGCNTCSCEADGSVSCTERGCAATCEELNQLYVMELLRAQACSGVDACTATRAASLFCGCDVYVDASAQEALFAAKSLAGQYHQRGCDADIACAPCEPLGPATCSPEGRCEEAPVRQ